jgi:hypothetical protein
VLWLLKIPLIAGHDLRVSVTPKDASDGTCATILIKSKNSARPLMQSMPNFFQYISPLACYCDSTGEATYLVEPK